MPRSCRRPTYATSSGTPSDPSRPSTSESRTAETNSISYRDPAAYWLVRVSTGHRLNIRWTMRLTQARI